MVAAKRVCPQLKAIREAGTSLPCPADGDEPQKGGPRRALTDSSAEAQLNGVDEANSAPLCRILGAVQFNLVRRRPSVADWNAGSLQ